MNKELEKYFVIADTVQEMNGDTCEVILHELTKSGSYVAYVANGTVTGQKTGEKSDYFVEQVLENKDFKDDHLSNYFFRTTDEKAVKSSSALLRDQDGDVIGMLCINMDITMLQNVNTMLMNYLKTVAISSSSFLFPINNSSRLHIRRSTWYNPLACRYIMASV